MGTSPAGADEEGDDQAAGALAARLAADAAPLLQELIRNACVNDGSPDSGQEARNADALTPVLDHPRIELHRFEPEPGRASLVARLPGRRPDGPTLVLHAPLDVAPAQGEGWVRDPFGGELVDGVVWGRGAVDLLHHVATAAVAIRHLAEADEPLEGSLTVVTPADGRCDGALGVRWLLANHPELLAADWAVASTSSPTIPGTTGPFVPVVVAEKGVQRLHVRVRGDTTSPVNPPETSATHRAAVLTERLSALAGPAVPVPAVVDSLRTMGWSEALPGVGTGRPEVDPVLRNLPQPLATTLWAFTHATAVVTSVVTPSPPTTVAGVAELEVLVSTLPGQDDRVGPAMVEAAAGAELAGCIEVLPGRWHPGRASTDHAPFLHAAEAVVGRISPGTRTTTGIGANPVNGNAYREAGVPTFGCALHDDAVDPDEFTRMSVGGTDERISTGSLGLTAALWVGLAHELLRAAGHPDAEDL